MPAWLPQLLIILAPLFIPVPPLPSPESRAPSPDFGIASWYGPPHHGRLTTSGQPFDMYALSAAHPKLPFGTRVRVINLRNGLSVMVHINDRGPGIPGRLIDLSWAAAQRLGFIRQGLALVRVEVVLKGAR